MPKLPYRDLAKFGVISDVDPYDLPLGAWSFAVNARFHNGSVIRAPVWRKVGALPVNSPRYVFDRTETSGLDSLFVGYKDGRVFRWANGSQTDYSIDSYSQSSVEATWSHTSMGGVTYVNRADRSPWGLTPGASEFVTIPGWGSGWQAKLFRTYNSALIALNVTIDGTAYPSLVKTSDIASDIGVIPDDWDHTDPTNNATENPLAQLEGPIVDACLIGNAMVIYGRKQAFLMEADGSDDVYRYRPLPFDTGAINANCSITIDGKQYVFGPHDIWMHDTISKVSLIDGKNREFVFKNMNISKAARFFVSYAPSRGELSFCYVSGDRGVRFTNATGCNRAAVLKISTGQWSFDNLPMVHSATLVSPALSALTYDNVTGSYDAIGGSYQDLEDGLKKLPVYVGDASTDYSLVSAIYGHDLYGAGAVISSAVDENATTGMTLERDGIDLDEINAELSGYKHVTSLYPQGRVDLGAAELEFAFGSSDYSDGAVVFSDYQGFNGRENYKLDYTAGGRFLSMRVRYDDFRNVKLSGLDVEVVITGGL